MNNEIQNYRGLKLKLKERDDYDSKRAKEYIFIHSKGYETQATIWIPNFYQVDDIGTLDITKNFMFIFNKSAVSVKLYGAGYRLTY